MADTITLCPIQLGFSTVLPDLVRVPFLGISLFVPRLVFSSPVPSLLVPRLMRPLFSLFSMLTFSLHLLFLLPPAIFRCSAELDCLASYPILANFVRLSQCRFLLLQISLVFLTVLVFFSPSLCTVWTPPLPLFGTIVMVWLDSPTTLHFFF